MRAGIRGADGSHAAAHAGGADRARAHRGELLGIELLLCGRAEREEDEGEESEESACGNHGDVDRDGDPDVAQRARDESPSLARFSDIGRSS